MAHMKGKAPLRVYIEYIGCERRKLDTQRILDYFLANGYVRTQNIVLADYCVLVNMWFSFGCMNKSRWPN